MEREVVMQEGRRRHGLCWPCAALAVGLTSGVGLWLIGAIAAYTTSWGHAFINAAASLYRGYAASWPGAFWGLFWGFLNGFIGTAVAVWLYNVFGGHEHRLCAEGETAGGVESSRRAGALRGEMPPASRGESARQPQQERPPQEHQ